MIVTCSLSDLNSVCNDTSPSHVISIFNPEFDAPSSSQLVAKDIDNHLILQFNDYIPGSFKRKDEQPEKTICNKQHIKTIVDFIKTWDKTKPIVTQCQCGVSRSVAIATYIMCKENPSDIEKNIRYIRNISPHADPSKLMVSLFEEHLNLDNTILNAFIDNPYTVKYDCYTNTAPVSTFNINDMKSYQS